MRWLITLLLATHALLVAAADRWYEIELIVFSLNDPILDSEVWPVLPAEPDLTDAVLAPGTIVLPTLPSLPSGSLVPSTRELLRVSTVPLDRYKLTGAYQSLNRSRLYTPLLHTAWRQPVGSGRNNVKVRIAGGKDFSGIYGIDGQRLDSGSPPAMSGLWQIDGFVSFRSQQLLFATVDMMFRRQEMQPIASTTTAAPGSNLTWQTGQAAPIIETEDKVQFYRMAQNRRVRSGDVQYFDHPLFGVMIEMRPLEPGLEEQLEEIRQ